MQKKLNSSLKNKQGGGKMQIKDICEIMGKTREEIESMLQKQDIIELKLTEKY
jgi:translation initiation factor 1 (eIF-1/SUI1)